MPNVNVTDLDLPTVFEQGNFAVKVYFSDTDRHHAPHFHVWIEGESVASISLATLTPLVGGPLPRRVIKVCEERVEEIWEAWHEHNPAA